MAKHSRKKIIDKLIGRIRIVKDFLPSPEELRTVMKTELKKADIQEIIKNVRKLK